MSKKNIILLNERMKIDCEKTTKIIVDFLKQKILNEKRHGICLGISGGLDSSVVASLAVRAVEKPKDVHGLHLFDRDSQRKFRNYAINVAEKLGLTFNLIDISDHVKKQGTYNPIIMKFVPYHPFINKIILFTNQVLSPILYGDSPFMVTLKRSNPHQMKFGFVAKIAKDIENGFNIRHIIRRKILEKYAEEHNLLLIGAANRSESFVGWFVKDGVDDLPIETLLGLYKNQVRQLGYFLNVPKNILSEAPSPDMFKGIGDEDAIGHKYCIIDKIAYITENNLDPQLLFNEGISKKEYDNIMKLNKLSEWKRENKHVYPIIT